MNGQTKDAFSKSKGGNWRYDIVSDGLKINMPDICAALALAQLQRYDDHLLVERMRIVRRYNQKLAQFAWFEPMPFSDGLRTSSFHIFPMRIKGISEAERDAIIDTITQREVAVNVHFMPLPMLSLFSGMGYDINDYPVAYDNYSREITLPVYPQLTNEQVDIVLSAVEEAVSLVMRS